MDLGFLFGWAKEQGIKVPQKSDGSANINERFALYRRGKRKMEKVKQRVPVTVQIKRSGTTMMTSPKWWSWTRTRSLHGL